MSLRLKTILGIALIEAVLLVVLITTVMDFMREHSESALVQRAETATSLFATTTKDAVLSFDLASLDAFTEEVMHNPGFVYARVLGADGLALAAAGDHLALTKPFSPDQSLDTVDDGVFDYFANIREGGAIYGRVEVGINTNSITEAIDLAREMAGGIALAEMLLVALFSFILGTYLTSQLRTLHKGALKISQGIFDVTIPVKGKDEVASVATAFNQMVENLKATRRRRDDYEKELKELNQTLEDRVVRRTLRLEEKNAELIDANETIKKAQAQLLQSEKMASVGQLAAGVAHEINNPIGFINSNLETLREYVGVYQELMSRYIELAQSTDEDDRKQKKNSILELEDQEDIEFVNEDIQSLLSDSIDGARRVRDIVQGMKNFSRADTAEHDYVDVNTCINSALKIAANELKYKCELKTELGEIRPVMCNSGQISQVVLNLVVNAGQAIRENGVITVKTQALENAVCISVQDNGCGISPENLDKLFEPFFTTKPVGEGTGLGLAIVYGIVNDHNGEITVDSEPGKGTTFTIRLPFEQNGGVKQAA